MMAGIPIGGSERLTGSVSPADDACSLAVCWCRAQRIENANDSCKNTKCRSISPVKLCVVVPGTGMVGAASGFGQRSKWALEGQSVCEAQTDSFGAATACPASFVFLLAGPLRWTRSYPLPGRRTSCLSINVVPAGDGHSMAQHDAAWQGMHGARCGSRAHARQAEGSGAGVPPPYRLMATEQPPAGHACCVHSGIFRLCRDQPAGELPVLNLIPKLALPGLPSCPISFPCMQVEGGLVAGLGWLAGAHKHPSTSVGAHMIVWVDEAIWRVGVAKQQLRAAFK